MSHQGGGHTGGHGQGPAKKSAIAKHGWKIVVVVALMLVAMAVYVLSLDDSIVPVVTTGGTTTQGAMK